MVATQGRRRKLQQSHSLMCSCIHLNINLDSQSYSLILSIALHSACVPEDSYLWTAFFSAFSGRNPFVSISVEMFACALVGANNWPSVCKGNPALWNNTQRLSHFGNSKKNDVDAMWISGVTHHTRGQDHSPAYRNSQWLSRFHCLQPAAYDIWGVTADSNAAVFLVSPHFNCRILDHYL